MAYSSRNLVLLCALLLVCLFTHKGYCRPHQDDEMNDSEYNDYEGDGDEDEEESGTPSPPPEFISKPINLSLRPGDNATLPCLTTGLGKQVLMWLNGSATLTVKETSFSSRVKKFPDNSLVIYNVSPEDSGTYTCQIISQPVMNLTHTLLVPSPAKITYHNETETIPIGQNVSLHCEASGNPQPNITWSKEGKPVTKAIFEDNGRKMTINNVAKHHAGSYDCTADNGIGKAATVSIHLVVNVPPQVRVDTTSLRSGEGEEVELSCTAIGHPKPQVKWLKNGVEIQKGPAFETTSKSNSHTLKIKKLQKSDFGSYTCSAHNKLGSDKKDISLSGLPSSPVLKHSQPISDDKVELVWSVESYAPIIQHVLQYRRRGASKWTNTKPEVLASNGNMYNVRIELSSLHSGVYEAVLRTENDFGWATSEMIVFEGIGHEPLASDEHSETHDASEQPAAETSIGEPGNSAIAITHNLITLLTAYLTVFVIKHIVL